MVGGLLLYDGCDHRIRTIAPAPPAEPLRTQPASRRRRTGHTSTGYGVCNRPHRTRHRECPLCRGVECEGREVVWGRAALVAWVLLTVEFVICIVNRRQTRDDLVVEGNVLYEEGI